jgi:hypothetical protein
MYSRKQSERGTRGGIERGDGVFLRGEQRDRLFLKVIRATVTVVENELHRSLSGLVQWNET